MARGRRKAGRRTKSAQTARGTSAELRPDAPPQFEPDVVGEAFPASYVASGDAESGVSHELVEVEQGDLFEPPDRDEPAASGNIAERPEPQAEPADDQVLAAAAGASDLAAQPTQVLSQRADGEAAAPSRETIDAAKPDLAGQRPAARDLEPAMRAQLPASAPMLPIEYVPLPGRRSFKRALLSVALGALNLIATTVLVFGLMGVASYLILQHYVGGKEVKVPTVVGISIDEALEKLNEPRLVMRLERREYSEAVPRGHIVAQFPLPGVTVKAGTPVRVVLSEGAARLRAPSVIGLTEINAGVALRSVENADLDIAGRAEVFSVSVKKGIVVAQDPPPGTPMSRGGAIRLLVSKGSPPVRYEMPNLRELTLPEARIVLGDMGLAITEPIRESDAPGVRRGIVVDQSPPPGRPVSRDDPIAVTIASGVGAVNAP